MTECNRPRLNLKLQLNSPLNRGSLRPSITFIRENRGKASPLWILQRDSYKRIDFNMPGPLPSRVSLSSLNLFSDLNQLYARGREDIRYSLPILELARIKISVILDEIVHDMKVSCIRLNYKYNIICIYLSDTILIEKIFHW